MKKTVLATSLLVLTGLVLGAPETSENIGYGAFQETTDRVQLVVGAQAAAISQHEKYIPLQIALAVRGAGPELEIALARFALIDASGNIIAPAPTEEMAKQASAIQFMSQYRRANPLPLGNQFVGLRPVASDFYPLDGSKFFIGEHLSRDCWLRDVLYFPTPAAGLAGVMTLQFLTPGMDSAVEVRFMAPIEQNRQLEEEQKQAEKAEKKEDKEHE